MDFEVERIQIDLELPEVPKRLRGALGRIRHNSTREEIDEDRRRPLDEFILGLDGKEIVLLALTAPIGILTFSSGRATVLQGAQRLAVFASFVFLSLAP